LFGPRRQHADTHLLGSTTQAQAQAQLAAQEAAAGSPAVLNAVQILPRETLRALVRQLHPQESVTVVSS
jgi:hypothetical protein